jgi:hypothetical protein
MHGKKGSKKNAAYLHGPVVCNVGYAVGRIMHEHA